MPEVHLVQGERGLAAMAESLEIVLKVCGAPREVDWRLHTAAVVSCGEGLLGTLLGALLVRVEVIVSVEVAVN